MIFSLKSAIIGYLMTAIIIFILAASMIFIGIPIYNEIKRGNTTPLIALLVALLICFIGFLIGGFYA